MTTVLEGGNPLKIKRTHTNKKQMKRRQLIKGLLATSALTMVDKVEAKNLFKDVGYWEEIKNAFPISSRYINLVNAGGGNVTTATLNLVSQISKGQCRWWRASYPRTEFEKRKWFFRLRFAK